MPTHRLILGDCTQELPKLPAGTFDVILTDPPYPMIDRPYGKLTVDEWFAMMRVVVPECMRLLKPRGSAVFILQPNSERVGRMRTWLWEFMAWVGKEWGIVQDFWQWNYTMAPTVHCQRDNGLARPSVKACVWVGPPDCYRCQDSVLWAESENNRTTRLSDRFDNRLEVLPSGLSMRRKRCATAAADRGGTTPFNLLPISNAVSFESAGAYGHGAGTPKELAGWWLRYLCPDDGHALDSFSGTATVGVAAVEQGLHYTGIERDPGYHAIAQKRLAAAKPECPLFATG